MRKSLDFNHGMIQGLMSMVLYAPERFYVLLHRAHLSTEAAMILILNLRACNIMYFRWSKSVIYK